VDFPLDFAAHVARENWNIAASSCRKLVVTIGALELVHLEFIDYIEGVFANIS
jgi:hypothetical protein